MGLFKSSEDKKNEKEEQKRQILEAFIKKNHFENLSPETLERVLDIRDDLKYEDMMTLGNLLSGSKVDDTALQINDYLKAVVKQNWIIIKLLDELKNK